MAVAVRCKFKLYSRTSTIQAHGSYDKETNSYPTKEVQSFLFQVVTDGSEEDKAFFASTPSGRLEIGVVNPEAVKELELNKTYFVTITPAD